MRLARRSFVALLLGAVALGAPVAHAAPAQVGSDDPGLSRQWGLQRIGAPAAWTAARGAGITIAIVDSGVAPDHPDLRDKFVGDASLVDCVGHDDVASGCVTGAGIDDAGHGTHVAGIAAASTDNGIGVAGVAPDAALLSVRALEQVCDDSGDCTAQGTTGDVAEAIIWAADHGAEVINLSLGSVTQEILGPTGALRDAIAHAWSVGSIPVLAAGNSAALGGLLDSPAVVVSATTFADTSADYSSGVGGARWGVAAPGGEADDAASCESDQPNGILSTWVSTTGVTHTAGYACVAGTSMAAPHVSGALAVLRSTGLTPQQAIDRLLSTADDLGAPGRDTAFGSGRINLARALGVSATGGPGVPTPDPTAPTTGDTTVDNTAPVSAVTSEPGPTSTTTATATPIIEPGVTTPPVVDEAATSLPLPGGGTDTLPAIPLTAAVLAVIATFSAHAWRYLSSTSWAQRTPDR